MTFESYFRASSYGLVATAFAALVLTGEVDSLSVAVYLAALITCIYADARGYKKLRLREWMWRLLAIGYVPFVFIDAAFLSPKILALVHMTLFLSAAKLFQEKTDRDWVFLYLIAFFQMLLAAGLTFNAVFICALTAFVFFFVSTLAAFEIRRTRQEALTTGEETIRRQASERRGEIYVNASQSKGAGRFSRVRYLIGAATTQLAAVVILTLPLFFLIPRSSAAGINTGLDFKTLTGFTDTVNLGDISKIKTSSQVVMRIKLDRNPGKWLHWRGIALDHYDGRSWTFTEDPGRASVSYQGGQLNGDPAGRSFIRDFSIDAKIAEMRQHMMYAPDSSGDAGELEGPDSPAERQLSRQLPLKQEVVLEPLTGGTLFSALRLARIRGPIRAVRVQDTRAVTTERTRSRIEYTAWSDISAPTEDDLRADNSYIYPKKIARYYLQLPVHAHDHVRLDPRIPRLARQITEGFNSPYDKARAIERYLKTNFTYTLDVKPTEGDPLAEFLFDTRAGFCEYFATAMAIMLRTIDIPSRVVNGFQMGEYNEISGFYTVRERDAHSWVEAYFPGNKAWVEFDPTPSAGLNDYSSGGLPARLRQLMDAAEAFWMDYVVTLDRNQQASIMVALQYRLKLLREATLSLYLSFKYWLMDEVRVLVVERRWTAAQLIGVIVELSVLALALVGIYVLWSYFRSRRTPPSGRSPWWRRLFILPGWRRKRDHRVSAIMFYEQMLAILSSRGVVKRPDQTPLEFAQANDDIIQVQRVTEIYNKVRFGGHRLDTVDREAVAALLSEIKLSLRRGRSWAANALKKESPNTITTT